ncbi:hypothetical protein CYY_010408 [Polysphondylium violaceum]|uniref:Uncharacterized protein n=1 Tax=Polysphondylium violaceum TaxID=133409 RepID=A0A8J4UNQ6_9MYCE|nr:hypothetical protein CYY_010408 [Polysphondylium violaceum]
MDTYYFPKVKCLFCKQEQTLFKLEEHVYICLNDILKQNDLRPFVTSTEINKLEDKHKDQIKILEDKHQDQIKILENKHQNYINLIRDKHQDQIKILEDKHQNDIKILEEKYRMDRDFFIKTFAELNISSDSSSVCRKRKLKDDYISIPSYATTDAISYAATYAISYATTNATTQQQLIQQQLMQQQYLIEDPHGNNIAKLPTTKQKEELYLKKAKHIYLKSTSNQKRNSLAGEDCYFNNKLSYLLTDNGLPNGISDEVQH